MVDIIFGTLVCLSFALFLWQLFQGLRFPLHQRLPKPVVAKPVTILKPMKGCDAFTEDCLRSWLAQEYPAQILFGVASPEDPVCDLVRSLIAEYPKVDAQLVICPKLLGPNAKVSTLVHLEAHVKHDILIISDADVWAPDDLVVQLIATLEHQKAALACCFYQMPQGTNLAMRLEAFAANSDFWTQVLQSVALKPMNFALGAVIALRRDGLARIGGFSFLLEYLADDYRLGNQLAEAGEKLVLCPVVVQCCSEAMGSREVAAHQIRWARTIRACQPVPFFFSVMANPLMWPLLLIGFPQALGIVAGMLAFRGIAGVWLERKLTREFNASSFFVAVLSDVFRLAFWASAFTGNRIEWRGRTFQVLHGGKLRELR